MTFSFCLFLYPYLQYLGFSALFSEHFDEIFSFSGISNTKFTIFQNARNQWKVDQFAQHFVKLLISSSSMELDCILTPFSIFGPPVEERNLLNYGDFKWPYNHNQIFQDSKNGQNLKRKYTRFCIRRAKIAPLLGQVGLIRIGYATLMMAQIRDRNAYLVVILCGVNLQASCSCTWFTVG